MEWAQARRDELGFEPPVVAHYRRAVYLDGSAMMYGSTDRADFSHVEGYEDHSLNLLFFWNEEESYGDRRHCSVPRSGE